tara:strand:+ start:231 stop:509 length:279 start_codon:yes stop_codon:yes gene_type:complete
MKKLILMSFIFLAAEPTLAGGHEQDNSLLDEKACKEMQQGIGELLGIADYFWSEIEKAEAKGSNADTSTYEGVAFYSQQAANYSVVYDVWCD